MSVAKKQKDLSIRGHQTLTPCESSDVLQAAHSETTKDRLLLRILELFLGKPSGDSRWQID